MLHGTGTSPSKGLRANQAASPRPCFFFTQWCSDTRFLLLTPVLSCLSYEDPSSLHVKWIHSGFRGGGGDGDVDSFSSHCYFVSRKIKKRIRFAVQPQFIMQHPRDRSSCLWTLEGNFIHCTQLRIRSGTGQALEFSFQTIASLKPFPLTLIFL